MTTALQKEPSAPAESRLTIRRLGVFLGAETGLLPDPALQRLVEEIRALPP